MKEVSARFGADLSRANAQRPFARRPASRYIPAGRRVSDLIRLILLLFLAHVATAGDEHELFPARRLGGVGVERELVGRFAHAAAVDRREVSALLSLEGIDARLHLQQLEFLPRVNYDLIGMNRIGIGRVSYSTTVDRSQEIACLGLNGARAVLRELDGKLFPATDSFW